MLFQILLQQTWNRLANALEAISETSRKHKRTWEAAIMKDKVKNDGHVSK
jgi:hypothetical protein